MTKAQLRRLRVDVSHRMSTEEWFELCDMAEKYMDAQDIFGDGPDVLVARSTMKRLMVEATASNREDAEESSPPTTLWPSPQPTTVKYLPCQIDVRGDDRRCSVCGQEWREGDQHPCQKS